jgi:hypothetical protein
MWGSDEVFQVGTGPADATCDTRSDSTPHLTAMHATVRTALLLALSAAAPTQAATRTVNETGDSGDGVCDATCTLRDAVDASQEDDRILFDLALPAPIVIELTGTPLQIDVPMRITATDGVPTTLRRTGGSGRLIEVTNGGDARIIGLAFENGSAPAAISIPSSGGAIYVGAGTTLELRDCTFRNNIAAALEGAPSVPGPSASGGALHAVGDLLIENCAFVANRASGGGGGYPGQAGGSAQGGAIHAEGNLTVLNSTFSANEAQGGPGSVGQFVPMPMTMGGGGGDGGAARGGAISIAATAAPTIAFSMLIGNAVVGGGAGSGGFGSPPGPNGMPGAATQAALALDAPTLLNTSVVAANLGATACGGAALTARTTNLVDDASCPGSLVAALDTQFDAIDPMAVSPHYPPKFDSAVVDAAPDCLDAVAFEAVDLDQLLTPRPLTVHAPAGRCDIGAIEHNPVLFGDGFEEPPPPP